MNVRLSIEKMVVLLVAVCGLIAFALEPAENAPVLAVVAAVLLIPQHKRLRKQS